MELELNWFVNKVRKRNGKEFEVYYIHIPKNIALFLRDYVPYLDLENKTIIFRKKDEKIEQERTHSIVRHQANYT